MIATKLQIALWVYLIVGGAASAADRTTVKNLLATKICPRSELNEAVLPNTNLAGVDLTGATIRDANLSGASLSDALLIGAILSGSNLKGAKLFGAELYLAVLKKVDLTDARLDGAKLNGAEIVGTKLAGAKLFGADLEGAVFEPVSLPDIQSVSDATGLKSLTYQQSPSALHLLRKEFKDSGLQNKQKEITYALMHQKRLEVGKIEGFLSYALFELTSDWGLAPLRPLWLMVLLVFPFAGIYAVVIIRPSKSAGLWRVWNRGRIRQEIGGDDPVQLNPTNSNIVENALYFSIISAFHVGWHEINIGTWISRLNPHEYTLRATGWVRSLSGFQSLVSIFLIALAFLTYYGDPFE
jgi:uncharacterized protein YjbI with pentapeptide repeats